MLLQVPMSCNVIINAIVNSFKVQDYRKGLVLGVSWDCSGENSKSITNKQTNPHCSLTCPLRKRELGLR